MKISNYNKSNSLTLSLVKEFISSSKDEENRNNDKLNLNFSSRALNKLDDFFNLGKPDRLDISDLSAADKKEFLKMLSKLLQKGIVGYEYLEVNGKKEKHFIVTQIGNERIKGAKLYKDRWKEYYKYRDENLK